MNNQDNYNLSKELGPRVKKYRIAKNMKIVDLAKLTGLTSSFISQFEHSIVAPSVVTLKRICNALDIPLEPLFESDSPADIQNQDSTRLNEISPVVRVHQRKILSPSPGITYYLLNPNLNGPIEFIYNIYEPGTGTGKGQYSHKGYECGLILEGELLVTVKDKEYLLHKGDSITFCSEDQHSKKNVGNTNCICIWANTPPYF